MKPKDVDVEEMKATTEVIRDSFRDLGHMCDASEVTIERRHYRIALQPEERSKEVDIHKVESKIRTALPGRFVEVFTHKKGDKYIEVLISR